MKMSTQDSSGGGYIEQVTTVTSSIAGYLKFPVLVSSGITLLLSSLLYFKQKSLIYPSSIPNAARTQVPRPSQFGISDFEELMIPTPDGEKLSAFYIRAPLARKRKNVTVLMFHGNAGNIGHRIPIARRLINVVGCSVLMLEYRGYGLSTGSPDEKGLMIDAQTGFEYLRKRAETRDNDIVIYGQSLGGAVSIQLAAKNQHDKRLVGLVLENTFLSMRKLIPSVLPPARYLAYLCHQVWPSDTYLPTITEVPILFLSGLLDELVPPSHMRRLFEICQSPPKYGNLSRAVTTIRARSRLDISKPSPISSVT
ncbi:Protein bem46 [Botrytis cinerea]